jgi:hypothetical protein
MVHEFFKKEGNKTKVLQISYVDLHGNPRVVKWLESGPAGNRWLLDNKDIVTIDLVNTTDGIMNPWKNARDIKMEWVDK